MSSKSYCIKTLHNRFQIILNSKKLTFYQCVFFNINLTFLPKKKISVFPNTNFSQSLAGNIYSRANEIIKYLLKYLSNLTCIYNS